MSPLIDVTNVGGQNCATAEKASKKSTKKDSGKFQKKTPLSNGLAQSGDETARRSSRGRISGGNFEPTKMCNTRSKDGSGGEPGHCYGSRKGIAQRCYVAETMRVPPLPQTSADDMLSQAVQALSLSPLGIHTKPSSRLGRHRKLSCKQTGRSSCGHPENPENANGAGAVRTPQQCGACGLEFTSVNVLTQHLAKHVYDGLYAAQWLTQAMALVPSRNPTNESLQTVIHSVPSDEGDNIESQSTQLSPPSGSNH